MFLADAPLTASEVLRAFHHDEPKLFMGAAFNTVTIVALGLCILRRRVDLLLISLAVFAHLYGLRLWLESDILSLTVPPSEMFSRFRGAINPLVPVPAFIFFQVAGLMPKRGKVFTVSLVAYFLSLTVAVIAFGRLPIFRTMNNSVIIVALVTILFYSLQRGAAARGDVVLRRGLLCFVGFALWDNTLGQYLRLPEVEYYGFAIFLACMGYVAARQSLERDMQLGEIERELEVARNIQRSILPGAFPESISFRVAAKYVPMTSVAGDLYDFVVADDNRAGLLIADVSGHGVPAALIASMVKMAALSQRANATEPALLLAGMNAALCGNTQGQYVTAAYVFLDAQTRELRYSAAGHPAMLMLRGDTVLEISENGLLLAAQAGSTYADKAMALEPGDRLLLYTDGLVEARNEQGKLFGEESLMAALKRTARLTPAEAVERIGDDVQRWSQVQDDDLTLLVCDYVATA